MEPVESPGCSEILLPKYALDLASFESVRPQLSVAGSRVDDLGRLIRDKNCKVRLRRLKGGHGNKLLAGLPRRGDRGRGGRHCHASRRVSWNRRNRVRRDELPYAEQPQLPLRRAESCWPWVFENKSSRPMEPPASVCGDNAGDEN
jgi:hypothetical protein